MELTEFLQARYEAGWDGMNSDKNSVLQWWSGYTAAILDVQEFIEEGPRKDRVPVEQKAGE